MILNSSKFNRSWDTEKLNKLGSFSRGKSKHRPRNDSILFVSSGGFPFIQTGEVKSANLYIKSHTTEYSKFGLKQSKLWKKGTLAITIAANIADSAILGYDMCFPDSVVGFEPFESKTTSEYMHYVLSFIQKGIQNSVNGSIQDNINIEYLQQLDFMIPKKNIQDKLLKVLLGVDKKIQTNTKTNAELEKMAKMLYDYWFVQFDFPNADEKPYKSSGGEMVYNETLKREIPKYWTEHKVKKICKLASGYPFSSDDYVEKGEYRLITIKNVQETGVNLQVDNYIDILPDNIPDFCLLKPCDILISLTGNVGRVGLMYAYNCLLNQRVAIAIPQKDTYRAFTYCLLKSDYFKVKMLNIAGGSSQSNLSTVDTENIIIAYDDRTIDAFNAKIEPFLRQIVQLEKQNFELAALRDFLLPLLMTGQVTVI